MILLKLNKSDIYTSVFFNDYDDFKVNFEKNLQKSDNYEIRFDLFGKKDSHTLNNVLDYLLKNDINYIFTYRSQNNEELLDVYDKAINISPIIDVDINSYNFKRELFNRSKLMLSFHGNNDDNVGKIVNTMLSVKPDIYKIALNYSDLNKFLDDMQYLMKFKSETGNKIAFIPMGEENSFLRVVSGFFLSDIMYASYRFNTAPGQLSLEDYMDIYRIFKL